MLVAGAFQCCPDRLISTIFENRIYWPLILCIGSLIEDEEFSYWTVFLLHYAEGSSKFEFCLALVAFYPLTTVIFSVFESCALHEFKKLRAALAAQNIGQVFIKASLEYRLNAWDIAAVRWFIRDFYNPCILRIIASECAAPDVPNSLVFFWTNSRLAPCEIDPGRIVPVYKCLRADCCIVKDWCQWNGRWVDRDAHNCQI